MKFKTQLNEILTLLQILQSYNPGQNYWLHSNYLHDMGVPNEKTSK